MSYGSAQLGHFVIILNGQWRLIHLFIIYSDHLKFYISSAQGRRSLIRRAGAGNMLIVNTVTNNNKIYFVASIVPRLWNVVVRHSDKLQRRKNNQKK